MNKIAIILFVLVALTGCSLFDTKVEYRDKLIPIYTVPSPPEIVRPELPIHLPRYSDLSFLGNPDNIGQIAQDYAISLRLALNYSQAQQEIINTYRNLSERDFANEPLLRSMGSPDGETSPLLFSGRESDNPEVEAFVNQVQFELYASTAFDDIVDKYEQRKKEIINNETE